MNLKQLAKEFPPPVQQGLKYVYDSISVRFRFGKTFWETYNFLQEFQDFRLSLPMIRDTRVMWLMCPSFQGV